MPKIVDIIGITLLRDKVFAHLCPRDVVNYQTATGLELPTTEFERYVSVFRFIIPHRAWLMDKVNNEGYTFTVICNGLYDFPNTVHSDYQHTVYLFVTDKEGNFVSCDEEFMPDALFESVELGLRLVGNGSSTKSGTRSFFLQCDAFGLEAEITLNITPNSFVTSRIPWKMAGYKGPLLEVSYATYASVYWSFVGDDSIYNNKYEIERIYNSISSDGFQTTYAVMDSNGYTIKHLLAAHSWRPWEYDDWWEEGGENEENEVANEKLDDMQDGSSPLNLYNLDKALRIPGGLFNADTGPKLYYQRLTLEEVLFSLQISVDKYNEVLCETILYDIEKTKTPDPDKYTGLLIEPEYTQWYREQ